MIETWKDQPGMLGVRLTFHHAWDQDWIKNGVADWFWPAAERLNIPVMMNAPTVLPEVGLKLGYDLCPNLRIYAGYDFLFISSVVRPGNQIDVNVNRTQIPNVFGPQALVGPAFPAPQFNPTTFWVQGFNFGMQYRY